jgi:site-specific recombinase XerD
MLERYFVQPATLDRIRASWIGEHIERYVIWLTEHRYGAGTVHERVPILLRFGAFAAAHGVEHFEELPAQIDGFVADRLRARTGLISSKTQLKISRAIRNTIEQMLTVTMPGSVPGSHHRRSPDPFAHQTPEFFVYLREERGLCEVTIPQYRRFLRGFEAYLNRVGCRTFGALSPSVLNAFIIESADTVGHGAMNGLCGALRVFLRYLCQEGIVRRDLSHFIERPRVYRLSNVPRSIDPDEVRRVLEVVDRCSPLGRRDYAILLLMVIYGLRGRDVAGLTLDDVDWKRDRLHVRERKADHFTVYPLSPVVGEAIVEYLKRDRPQTADRHLFFRHHAPHTPLTQCAASSRASYYLRKAGVHVRRAGSHTLRHTCVQRLVDAGFSLKTIGDYVGHRSTSSTEIYTKIAVETLRNVALGDGEALP